MPTTRSTVLLAALLASPLACARTAAPPAEAPAPVTAQANAAAAPSNALPPAQRILDRYAAAIGGRETIMRHNSYRVRGTFEMPGAGVKGDMDVVHAKPNKMAVKVTIPGMGEIQTGYDGTVGWSVNPMQGPRLLEGKELEQISSEAEFTNLFRGASNIVSRETVERTEMGGQPCYKVKITWKSGRETFDCYSTETGLLVGTTSTQESPMGSVQVTSLVSDYKDFGGVKYATRMRQQMMGQEQVMTVHSVEFDVVPPSAFEQPPAIQALVKQKSGQ